MWKTSTQVKSSISLAERVRTCARLKAALLVALTTLFCVPYVYLAHYAMFPVHDLPLTPLDHWAGFDTRWVWVYQSIYLITATLPWLASSRAQLMRYIHGFTILVIVCFAIYIFFPVRVPRPGVDSPTGMYWVLLLYDGPYNAFPSLHAGFLYYTLAFARRVYGRPSRGIAAGLIIWSALILWSTLATKEHYFIDLVAGIALAMVCDLAAWRSTFRKIGEKSQDGAR